MAVNFSAIRKALNEDFITQPKPLHLRALERTIQPVAKEDLAQYLVTHSFGASKTIGKSIAAKQGAESEGPSLLSKFFDALSGPMYATENMIQNAADNTVDVLRGKESPLEAIKNNAVGNAKALASIPIRALESSIRTTPIPHSNEIADIIEKPAHKLAPKMFGSDLLQHAGVDNKYAKAIGGFGIDVAADPLTYVPGLDVVSIFKKAKAAKAAIHGFRTNEDIARAAAGNAAQKLDAAAATDGKISLFQTPKNLPRIRPVAEEVSQRTIKPQSVEVPQVRPNVNPPSDIVQKILGNDVDMAAMKAMRRTDNAHRAANIRWGKPEDWHDIPEMTLQDKADFADRLRDGKMAKEGKVSDGKGFISNRGVTAAIQDIANGTLPRFGRIPESASGDFAAVAKQVANEFIKKPGRQLGKHELSPADQANLYNSLRGKAAELFNEAAKKAAEEKPVKPLKKNVQRAVDYIEGELKGRRIGKTKDAIEKEVRHLKYVNTKADKNAILKHFFPREPIRNPAATPVGKIAVGNLARQMLRTAEDHLIATGHNPVALNGMRARLSDILEEVGPVADEELPTRVMNALTSRNPHAVVDPNVAKAVNTVLGRRSLAMSDLLGELSDRALQAKKAADNALIGPKARKLLDALPKAGQEAVKEVGATSEESKAIYDALSNIVHLGDTPVDDVMRHLGPDTIDAVMSGRVNAKEIKKINKAIIKSIGSSPEKLANDVTGNTVIDAVATRFATVYGRQEELKKFSEDFFRYAEQNAANRAKLFTNIIKKYPKETIVNAFKIAQNRDLAAVFADSDPAALELSKTFTDYFENMLGSTGFNDIKDFAGTVAARSQIIMTDVNKHLKAVGSNFQFSRGKVPIIIKGGEKTKKDFGDNWLATWELADPRVSGQDPISFMYDMDLAIQRTVAENRVYDGFAMRFGASKSDPWFNPAIHKSAIPHPRLKDLYFHPDVRNEFLRLIHDLEEGAYRPHGETMRFLGKITRIWKSSVTIYFPSHHIRNLIGDNFNTWLAGYNDPRLGYKAAKVLMSQKNRYRLALKDSTYDVLKGLIDKEALDITEGVPGNHVIFKNKYGPMTAEQLWASGYKRGLFISYNKIEDIFGEAPFGSLNGDTLRDKVLTRLQEPFGGHAHDAAVQISEYREHFARMTHYIGAVDKYMKKYKGNLEKAYDEAAHEVRKWHPDGTDLTQFEQKIRYVIPFYAWTRKEIPLLMQSMIERPAKLTAYPKAQHGLQELAGIQTNDQEGFLDPFPNDQMFPYWIRSTGIGPIGDPTSDNFFASYWGKLGATVVNGFTGKPSGYTVVNPSNPLNDVATSIFGFGRGSDIARNLLNNASPLINIPADLATNQTFSGAPITKDQGGQGVPSFLAQQFPQVNAVTRVTGMGGKKRENVEGQNRQNIINILTALGLRGTGPYETSAEFEAKSRAQQRN